PKGGAPLRRRQASKTLDARLAHSQKLLRPSQLYRSVIEAQRVPPTAQARQRSAPPLRQMNILNRRPAGADYQFEVIDMAFQFPRKPRNVRIVPRREIEPTLAGPFL